MDLLLFILLLLGLGAVIYFVWRSFANRNRNTKYVDIVDFAFQPNRVNAQAGEKIIWTNKGAVPHTVTDVAKPPAYDSGVLQSGRTWTHAFQKPGQYNYYCTLHPNMKGTVVIS